MKSVAIHAVLALLGLTVAYVVWTEGEQEERSAEEVVVVDCDPDHLDFITLADEDRTVKLEMRRDGDDKYSWITITRREGDDETVESFAGAKAVEEYAQKIAPFRALRSLGELSREELQAVELEPGGATGEDGGVSRGSTTTLELSCGGRARRFKVGGSAYGSGDRYLRDEHGGAVYLVSADTLRELESAQFRLMQRDLHAFEWTEVEIARISGGGAEKALYHRNRRTPDTAIWVDNDARDRINETYGNWLDRLQRLRIQKYLEPDAEPGSDLTNVSAEPEPILEVVYTGERNEPLGRLQLVKVAGETNEYYARTEATRTWVKVLASVAEQVERDVRPILGLEPLPEPERPDAEVAPPLESADAGTDAAEGETDASAADADARTGLLPVPVPALPDLPTKAAPSRVRPPPTGGAEPPPPAPAPPPPG